MARAFRVCTRALSTKPAKPLYGTVPSHSSYVLLRSNQPPSEFPVTAFTPLQRELQLRTLKLGTIINFAWTGEPHNLPGDKTAVTAFSKFGGRLEISEVSLENINEVEAILKEHIERKTLAPNAEEETHVHICTHAARDCRCGERGTQVVRALREEVAKRNLTQRIKIREVGHVGGHKYAANMLVYPQGEWLGQLQTDDICRVIDAILSRPIRPFTDRDSPLLLDHWRGRMGFGKDEQISFFENYMGQRNE